MIITCQMCSSCNAPLIFRFSTLTLHAMQGCSRLHKSLWVKNNQLVFGEILQNNTFHTPSLAYTASTHQYDIWKLQSSKKQASHGHQMSIIIIIIIIIILIHSPPRITNHEIHQHGRKTSYLKKTLETHHETAPYPPKTVAMADQHLEAFSPAPWISAVWWEMVSCSLLKGNNSHDLFIRTKTPISRWCTSLTHPKMLQNAASLRWFEDSLISFLLRRRLVLLVPKMQWYKGWRFWMENLHDMI